MTRRNSRPIISITVAVAKAYRSDGEGSRAFDRRHAHHLVDCVLPSGGLRQSVDHDCGRDRDRDKPESPFSLPRCSRQPKPRPQESGPGADTIKGRKGKPCHGALQHAGAGNEAWRKGCKKGQSAQNKAKCLGRRKQRAIPVFQLAVRHEVSAWKGRGAAPLPLAGTGRQGK